MKISHEVLTALVGFTSGVVGQFFLSPQTEDTIQYSKVLAAVALSRESDHKVSNTLLFTLSSVVGIVLAQKTEQAAASYFKDMWKANSNANI